MIVIAGNRSVSKPQIGGGKLPGVPSPTIGSIDLAIVVLYVAATTLLGVFLAKGQQDNRDYFLGGHRLPTWALLISIVATETSTVTFLSIPGLSYKANGNFTFLQLAMGYIVGRVAIVLWLLPSYFRGEMLTAYQVLEGRFGTKTRRVASLVFLVTRNLADGLRLFLTALALNVATDAKMIPCILATSIATAVYTFFGGVRSVVWNDCIQFAVYMLGAFAAIATLVSQIPGGWSEVLRFGMETDRLRVFDFSPSLTQGGVTFWSGIIGGAFLSLATHGADQLIVQRYLCAKNKASAAWALILSGIVVFAQFMVFLFIGLLLATFDTSISAELVPGDEAFMTFVINHMGTGLKGLILAAVLAAAMSTLSGSLNSSASSLMSDWLGPFVTRLDDRRSLAFARLLTAVFAAIQTAVAIAAYQIAVEQSTVDVVLKIAGFSTGLLLGVYGLGLFVSRATEPVALTAFAIGTGVTTYVAFYTPLSGWWYALVGSGTTFITGVLLSSFSAGPRNHVKSTGKA